MLTVLRILAPASQLRDVADALDRIDSRAGVAKPRARGDGYYFSLCEDPSWAQHCAAIVRFVEPNRDPLAAARAKGATLAVDVMVDGEDRQDHLILSLTLSEDAVEALASVSARFVVSIYAGEPGLADFCYRLKEGVRMALARLPHKRPGTTKPRARRGF